MVRKLNDILFVLLNLGVLAFFVYGASLYPDSPLSPFIFLIALAVVLYAIFNIVWRINNIFVNNDIKRYIDSGFDPRSVRR